MKKSGRPKSRASVPLRSHGEYIDPLESTCRPEPVASRDEGSLEILCMDPLESTSENPSESNIW
jgi:hypothetical protein